MVETSIIIRDMLAIGTQELILVLVIVFLLYGSNKLPEVTRNILKMFKRSPDEKKTSKHK